jgi:hypothetical protein
MHGQRLLQTPKMRQSIQLTYRKRSIDAVFTHRDRFDQGIRIYSTLNPHANLEHARKAVKPLVSAAPSTFDFRLQTKAKTEKVVRECYPELLDLANSGTAWCRGKHCPWCGMFDARVQHVPYASLQRCMVTQGSLWR